MSDQTKEKERSLTELMVRILKEPLKPLGQSMAGLNGELSDIKEGIEEANGMLSLCQGSADESARQSKATVQSLRSLRDEQSAWVPTLKACISEHAQSVEAQLGAHSDRSATALAAMANEVRSTLADIRREQCGAAQAIDALPEHFSRELGATSANLASVAEVLQEQMRQSQVVLEKGLEQGEAQWSLVNAAMASGLKDATARVGQLLTHQERTVQAAHQAMLEEMKHAAGQAQSTMAENLRIGQVLCESLNNSHAELMAALSQHTELLNARFDQSQAKVRHLALTMGIFFVSMLTYIAYDLLSKLS